MTLWFSVGTAAELIKIFPLITEAAARNLDWRVVSSGQNGANFDFQYRAFGLPSAKLVRLNSSSQDFQSGSQAVKWFFSTLFRGLWSGFAREFQVHGRSPQTGDYWFVHGDTLSTLVGAVIGARLRTVVCHVEAGLRSGRLFNPFPEEINRRLVSHFASFHFCPDEFATRRLQAEEVSGTIVNTKGNTVMDAIPAILASTSNVELPSKPYVLVNLHRFENLSVPSRWEFMMETVLEISKKNHVLFVALPPTQARLKDGWGERLRSAGVAIIERQPFAHFIRLLNHADFVVSDGGSNQEEASYLGVPCLLLRLSTERREGLGANVVLSGLDPKVVSEFLQNPSQYRRAPSIKMEDRPTEVIFSELFDTKPG